ncbi:MAG: Hsp20/alpha crystallin family protein, partial [Allosphingosinicella sp.]
MAKEETLTNPQTEVAKPRPASFTDQLVEPFSRLRDEVDRLFDDFPFRFPAFQSVRTAMSLAVPAIEMTETDKAYKITAELPGIDPDDIELTFENDMLRIAGEKKEEREEDERGFSVCERSYGRFERIIALPAAADGEAIKASFRKGVLKVTVLKDAR